MILTLLLIALLSLSVAIYLFYKRNYQHWKNLGIPSTKPLFPFGNAKGISTSKSLHTVVNGIYNEYTKERVIGFWILFRPVLLVRDPELVKAVLIRDFMTFHDRGIHINSDDKLGSNLFLVRGQKWRNIRVKLTPAFSSGKMKMMFPILAECGHQLKSVLDARVPNGGMINVREYASRFAIDIIALCAFGLETDSLNKADSDFHKYGKTLLAPSFVNLWSLTIQRLAPQLANIMNLRFTEKATANFFLDTLGDAMSYREKNNIRRKDFLDILIQLKTKGTLDDVDESERNDDGYRFTFEEATAQAYIFFVAAFEMPSTTMQYATFELAKHPDIQRKVRDEINTVLRKHNNELSFDAVMEMDYLRCVVDETLRKYPPTPVLQRVCNKDYHLEPTNYFLPKGCKVIIDVYGMHHDPQFYPDPEKFDPERFKEGEKSKRPPCTYMPFGEGPRNCVAMRFGLLQTKVGMITLLRNYEFSLPPNSPDSLQFNPTSFTLQPLGGVNVVLNKT